jgi:hypothetical protein
MLIEFGPVKTVGYGFDGIETRVALLDNNEKVSGRNDDRARI